MSFWKKLFGKSEQPVAEAITAEDEELQESQLDSRLDSESSQRLRCMDPAKLTH